jgi:hypothetical protein
MKKTALILLLAPLSGCAYLQDRGRDAADIVTVAAESRTVNASFQFGEAVLGAGLAKGQGFGLRSGVFGSYTTKEANLILLGGKSLVPSEQSLDRGKGYECAYLWMPWFDDDDEFFCSYEYGEWYNHFQIEATVGLGAGVRAGFNPAELVDFILGWTTLDICKDDRSDRNRQEPIQPKESGTATIDPEPRPTAEMMEANPPATPQREKVAPSLKLCPFLESV